MRSCRGAGEQLVRTLHAGGEALRHAVVWVEAFGACELRCGIRWSMLREGAEPCRAVKVSYQSYEAGGCTNGNMQLDDGGVLMETGVDRIVPAGTQLGPLD